ncbi:MAG: hypothetical protein WAO58_05080 [Fimbriimonadaceae bacterium]
MRRLILPFFAVGLPFAAIIAIGQSSEKRPVSSAEAIELLESKVPGVQFYMAGEEISRIYGKPFARGESPVDTAGRFVSTYGAAFNPGDAMFEFDRTQDVMNGKFTAVYFNQKLRGVPVDGGNLTVLVKNEQGYPAVLASSNVKEIEGIPTSPRVTRAQAANVVKKADRSLRAMGSPELVVYRGKTDTYLAWSMVADNVTKAKPKKFRAFVDANSGRILEWRNLIYTIDVAGSVQGVASPGLKPDNSTNAPVQMAVAGLRVAITGGNFAYSNSLGDFVISNGGNSQVTVTGDMRGRWVNVVPEQGTALALSLNVTPPGPANFFFNTAPTEFATSQVNALRHTELVHDFAKGINNTYPGIDVQMTANVNIDSTCNAFYAGDSINFFVSAGANSCPNTAYSTVVYHEYGHHIVASGHPGASGDYHEGMADTTAVMLTNQPNTGEDFSGPNTGPLRSAINGFNYPCNGAPHDCGNVISGAFWLTNVALKSTIGDGPAITLTRSWYLNSILLRPNGITPAITIDVLTLDDDNGDITDGTPHYTEIEQGFGAKNLHAPPLSIGYDALTVALFAGQYVSGNLGDILVTDDAKYIASTVDTSIGLAAGIETSYVLDKPANLLQAIKLKVEASAVYGATGMVWFWNYNTNAWQFVKAQPLTATDTTKNYTITTNLARFVGPNGEVRAIFRAHTPKRLKVPFGFQVKIDLAQLQINWAP